MHVLALRSVLVSALAVTALLPFAAAAAPPTEPSQAAVVQEAVAIEQDAGWQRTLDDVVRGVVSIRVTGVRDFDTEDAGTSVGTGFIVDAERGILLTNRHMVHAGPVRADATLVNNEEIRLEPIYRDPVHDFGFYRFDPKQIRYLKVHALPLAPQEAKVGLEVRVVGNDAGEKVSILDGTLARLDRNAPAYGGDTYNDFNTFYYQAASNTSGGSSGSPVVNRNGQVVALNAGGTTRAASSFYLPLHRVVRALDAVQKGETPSRGTLQAVFSHTSFAELRRLGLTEATETRIRQAFPSDVGMLVMTEAVPNGPVHGKLLPGDVLVAVNDQPIVGFVALEEALDDSVGKPIHLDIERGGEAMKVEVEVGDLHAITPSRYLEVGRAVVHDLSYQQARNYKVPVGGVYVAVGGYVFTPAGISEGAVITHLDDVPTPNLDVFRAELEKKAQGQRLTVRFFRLEEPTFSRAVSVVNDRLWFPMKSCVRDDKEGFWPCTASPDAPEQEASGPFTAPSLILHDGSRIAKRLVDSFVMIDFDIPYPTAGVKDFNYVGVGTIIDAERGLVLVDRDTVPVALGDMTLTFRGTVRVPGKLVYLHPVHNFAVIQYDPAALFGVPVRAVRFSDKRALDADDVVQVGLSPKQELITHHTTIDKIDTIRLGMNATPRFRDSNVEAYMLDESEGTLGGVLTDKQGKVVALWASFLDQASGDRGFFGLPYDFLAPALEPLLAEQPVVYRALGAELSPVSLLDARDRGLPDRYLEQLLTADPKTRAIFEVSRVWGGANAQGVLMPLDLVLAIDGQPVTRMRHIESLAHQERAMITVLREGEVIEFLVSTTPLDGDGIERMVSWAGLVLHAPHHEVAAQRGIVPSGVYASWLWYGTPAAEFGLRPTRRIVQVNDKAVGSLDDFMAAVDGLPDGSSVRLTLESLDGRLDVQALELDYAYWPTIEFLLTDGTWTRTVLSATP